MLHNLQKYVPSFVKRIKHWYIKNQKIRTSSIQANYDTEVFLK